MVIGCGEVFRFLTQRPERTAARGVKILGKVELPSDTMHGAVPAHERLS